MMSTNVMIVGVGGQGSLLASKLLGYLLLNQGLDVKVSEVHGMSQRGGNVVTYVKFGEKVYSPVVGKGEADFIVSFEKLEAARWVESLKPDGRIIVSSQQIDPMPVLTGQAEYPKDLIGMMKSRGFEVEEVNGLQLAEQAGSSKAVNLVLMGVLSKYFSFPEEAWQEAIEACVPSKVLELNRKAFAFGRNLALS